MAKGRWSDTKKGKSRPVDITIVEAGESVSLSCKTGTGNNVDLKLRGPRELTGTLNHMAGRQRRNADVR